MRQSPEKRLRASSILAREVSEVLCKKLQSRGGWTLEKVDWSGGIYSPPPPEAWHCSWLVKNDGTQVAKLNVSSNGNAVLLHVYTDALRMFTHEFKLHGTDSPRKIACLLVEWLKQSQIFSVMKG